MGNNKKKITSILKRNGNGGNKSEDRRKPETCKSKESTSPAKSVSFAKEIMEGHSKSHGKAHNQEMELLEDSHQTSQEEVTSGRSGSTEPGISDMQRNNGKMEEENLVKNLKGIGAVITNVNMASEEESEEEEDPSEDEDLEDLAEDDKEVLVGKPEQIEGKQALNARCDSKDRSCDSGHASTNNSLKARSASCARKQLGPYLINQRNKAITPSTKGQQESREESREERVKADKFCGSTFTDTMMINYWETNPQSNRPDLAFEAQQDEMYNTQGKTRLGGESRKSCNTLLIGENSKNDGEESIVGIDESKGYAGSNIARRTNWSLDNAYNKGQESAILAKESKEGEKTTEHEGKDNEEGKAKNTYKSILMSNKRDDQMEGQSPGFKKNRNWNRGLKLEFVEEQDSEEDEVQIIEEDLDDVIKVWGVCLVGYIAGDNIGKGAIISCCKSWDVKHKINFDESGWVVINFESEADRNRVLENGPYVIFKTPFILKPMPALFSFNEEMVSKVPLWVRLPNLPLELWTEKILSRIGSKIGTPIRTDELTGSRDRKSFARIFVEVDVSKETKKEIKIKFSNGKEIYQRVTYEYIPLFCKKCKAIGHSDHMCLANGKFTNFQFRKPEYAVNAGAEKKNNKQSTNIRNGYMQTEEVINQKQGGQYKNMIYREKGKAAIKEDPGKSFVHTEYGIGAGKLNPKNVSTTYMRKGMGNASYVVGDHNSRVPLTSKYLGENALMIGTGESNHLGTTSTSNQEGLGKYSKVVSDHGVRSDGTNLPSYANLETEDSREFLLKELQQFKQWSQKEGMDSEQQRNETLWKALEFVGKELSRCNKGNDNRYTENQHNARTHEDEWSVPKKKKRKQNKNKGANPLLLQ